MMTIFPLQALYIHCILQRESSVQVFRNGQLELWFRLKENNDVAQICFSVPF
jgi:hypothetical protein